MFVEVYQQKYALAALEFASGNEMWEIQQGSTEAPYWQDGRLYVASGTSVLIVDGASGKIQRRFAAPTEVITTPIPDGELVLFGRLAVFYMPPRRIRYSQAAAAASSSAVNALAKLTSG